MTDHRRDSGTSGESDRAIRVLLADDDALVRAGIAAILSTATDIIVVAEASDGAAALDSARRHALDVTLLDIQMPGMNGIRLLEQLRREQPSLPNAMLTTFSDEDYVAEAIGLGALGFFLKSDDPRHLIAGVRALAGGGAAFSPRVARWLVRHETLARLDLSRSSRSVVEDLTHRQRDLLIGLGRGQSNAQIAKSLHLSEGTVKQYLSTLFTRLGVNNRVQAALIAHDANLFDSSGLTTRP